MVLMFRADKPKKNIKNMDMTRLRLAIKGYLDIINESHCGFQPPKYQLCDVGKDRSKKDKLFERIEKIAREQRDFLGIRETIPENYFQVLEDIGINILARDFHNEHYDAVSSYSEDYGSFIIINDAEHIPEERKLFS